MKYQVLQQNIESGAKAPKELKQKTFTKIAQMNTLVELMGFFANTPKVLLQKGTGEDLLNKK